MMNKILEILEYFLKIKMLKTNKIHKIIDYLRKIIKIFLIYQKITKKKKINIKDHLLQIVKNKIKINQNFPNNLKKSSLVRKKKKLIKKMINKNQIFNKKIHKRKKK